MIDFTEDIDSHLNESKVVLEDMRSIISEKAITFAKIISNCFCNNGKLIWCGNGGSASECLHLSAEFVGRFKSDREPLASIALSSDISALTCISNDYSFEDVFSRQIEALGKKEDVLICLSTSGNSLNVLKAIESAKKLDLDILCFLGKKGGLAAGLVKNEIIIKSDSTARVQEMHLMIGHIVVELVEKMMGYE